MGEIILVASGKGGSGKTTFAVNIAGNLAENGYRTIVLDFNVGLRNADIYMGMENRVVFDLGDVVSGVCGIEKAIVGSFQSDHPDLLCCPQYKEIEGFGEGHVHALYSLLRERYDYVIVDSPAGLGRDFCCAAAGADRALILLTMDHLALRNADAVDRRLEAIGIAKRFSAINLVNRSTWGSESLPDIDTVSKTLGCPLIGIIQADDSIHLANNEGQIASIGNESVHELFRTLTSRLIDIE